MNRRDAFKAFGATTGLAVAPSFLVQAESSKLPSSLFQYCLNTSTINVEKTGLKQAVEITARAGYDHIELWIPDIKKYLENGNTLASLNKHIRDSGLGVANAIGFAPWMVHDEARRKAGFLQMEEEMNIMAALECKRIAAAPAGITADQPLDLFAVGGYFKELIALGKKTGVMPQLEFWGMSPAFYHLGQVLMVAATANDPAVRILADVFHLFRGGSGFDGLKLINGACLEIFHMNDYPSIARAEQKDKDRVFPGDGVGPVKQVLQDLSKSGGTKILSLELFNPEYWKKDPLEIARTGLQKMKAL
jgi:2-keto-myo-inositol isomerase